MQIELLDQPILIVKSASPQDTVDDSPQETLSQIESLLEDEIIEIRKKLHSDEGQSFTPYMSNFNLHLQTDSEVVSVVLESEWKNQMGEGFNSHTDLINGAEEVIDLEVSDLMRIIKLNYNDNLGTIKKEKKKLFAWLAEQSADILLISGLASYDYLLVSAKDILNSMNGLNEVFDMP